ncbi:hypothetical protein JYU34_015779 [Plutella xylostella]|uniref:P/Homo B domain-containing protein n=2 Tax=Plutella xylostella TaxID=51655 RepID=A0ABQ7Q4N7_PLUXY|nr:hypothetical protein JYU34_015779 [Plutella xylostella]
MCSSTLAATYSSGAINEKQVVTTDLHHSCTAGHTGTSASAPLAAGICALALQANKDLTWRDMQHIVVRTARPERLSSGGEWRVNGVGRNVSHSFGYGLLDAGGMVRLARAWRTVPAQRKCELAAPRPQRAVPPRSHVTLQLDVGACPGVNYLEHVQARVSLSASRRGDLRITLTSPAGTRVTLLAPRAHDSSRAGFNSWPFMSVHMWGEAPLGIWQLEVSNEGRYMAGPLTQWELIFYGTETPPHEESVSQENNSLEPNPEKAKPWSRPKVEEVPHNAIEDDMALVWHDTHTVRDSGLSKAAESEASTSSGCSTHSPQSPLHCLECSKGMHLFGGRCYRKCPEGTYASEVLTERSSRRRNFTYLEVGPKKKRFPLSKTEADDMEQGQVKSPLICLPCHYTCAACTGPQNYHCQTCPEDAQLVNQTDTELKLYCYPSAVVPQITEANWHYKMNVFLSIALFVASCISLYCLLTVVFKKFGCCRGKYDSNLMMYHKVAPDDKSISAMEVEDEIHKALGESSDDESEDDDLNL